MEIIAKGPVAIKPEVAETTLTDSTTEQFGTGWLMPMPHLKDYTEEDSDIPEMAKNLNIAPTATLSLPSKVDLTRWCSPIENQGSLGSCTAHAAAGVVEYFERRAHGRHIDGSRLFVYKATRNLMGVTGDTGAWLRNTMGALALCGIPPEKYWQYTTNKNATSSNPRTFDDEPTSFVYSVADNFEALRYFCHDPQSRNIPPEAVLNNVKRYLAAGIPSMFGFFGFPSFNSSDKAGSIPYPCPGERAQWGHAITAVGYDDNFKITNTRCNRTTQGALLIRNSWGTGWGNQGYGWLPYEYAWHRLAVDFWSMLNMEWVDTKQFGL